MIRLIATAFGAAIGYALGLLLGWPIIGAIIGGFIGLQGSGARYSPMPGAGSARISESIDQALITFWLAGPALRRLSQSRPGRYANYEETLYRTCMSELLEEQVYNSDEIIRLIRESQRLATPPVASLRRHNRKHKPGLFRKTSPTYTLLSHVADVFVEAGADERGILWFVEQAQKLKVKREDALAFVLDSYERQCASPTMLPGSLQGDEEIVKIGEGIAISPALAPYLPHLKQAREKVLEVMFPASGARA